MSGAAQMLAGESVMTAVEGDLSLFGSRRLNANGAN
jgi:hypothetical protein